MTTQPVEPYDDDNQNQPDPGGQDNALIRDLRERANAADAAKAEAKAAAERALAAEKRVALLELGVQPDSAQGKKLIRLHDGDWTADALRTTATEYGEQLPSAVTPEQEAVAQRVAQVGVGSESPTDVGDIQSELNKLPKYGEPGWAQGREQFHDVIRRHGGSVERRRLTAAEQAVINPMTGRPMKGSVSTPVTQPSS